MSEKSNGFLNALKIVSVLLVICLVCGALLALCNDLMFIPEETRFKRSMEKVYKGFEEDKEFSPKPVAEYKKIADVGEIKNVYRSTDGVYILESVGFGGWDDGNVTMYIVVGLNEANTAIIKSLAITDNTAQSYISKISQKKLTEAYANKTLTELEQATFGSAYKLGGTTYTSTAILNSVKVAVNYAIKQLKLASTPESEALDKVIETLGDKATGYAFTKKEDNGELKALSTDTDTLNFFFVGTKQNADTLGAYVYGDGETGHKVVVVKNDLTHSQRLESDAVVVSSENISALVEKVQSLGYFEYTIKQYVETFVYEGESTIVQEYKTRENGSTVEKVISSSDGTLVITAKGTGGYPDGNGTVTIDVVIAEGKVKGWYIVASEKQTLMGNIYSAPNYQNWYVGQSIESDISLGNFKVSGATMTCLAINNAINMAGYYVRSITA